MTTQCRFGILNEDGSVESIEVYYDGYPSHMIPMLNQYSEKIRDLLKMGDLSELKVSGPVRSEDYIHGKGSERHQNIEAYLFYAHKNGSRYAYLLDKRWRTWETCFTSGAIEMLDLHEDSRLKVEINSSDEVFVTEMETGVKVRISIDVGRGMHVTSSNGILTPDAVNGLPAFRIKKK
jgi:hypothetical protein